MAFTFSVTSNFMDASQKRVVEPKEGEHVDFKLFDLKLNEFVASMLRDRWYVVAARTTGFSDPTEKVANVALFDGKQGKWRAEIPIARDNINVWPTAPASLFFPDPDNDNATVGAVVVNEVQLKEWGVAPESTLGVTKWPELGGIDEEPELRLHKFFRALLGDAKINALLVRSKEGRELLAGAKSLRAAEK